MKTGWIVSLSRTVAAVAVMATVTATVAGVLVLTVSVADADLGDCGQPVTEGDGPVASDCLACLRVAVDADLFPDTPCICDTNGDGQVLAGDALRCLLHSVGTPGVGLDCPAPCGSQDPEPGCSSVEWFPLAGSEVDLGWTGGGHNTDLAQGNSITFEIQRRCGGDGDVCTDDADCDGTSCEPTCDCGTDTSCEITGPTHPKRCLTTLASCTTDEDCPFNCVHMFGPPLPRSAGGTGSCTVPIFAEPVTGTMDPSTGASELDVRLGWRVFLGETAKPCPRCGEPGDPGLEIGASFTCDGGQANGQACTVHGVSAKFGGTSYDCAPNLGGNISGIGLAVNWNDLTTETVTQQALLPCAGFGFTNHPSRGDGVCTDTFEECSSNSDCKRCEEDGSTACDSDEDCTGSCLEGPDTAVTCGYWCACGSCTLDGIQDPDAPCMSDAECDGDATCEVGKAQSTQPTAPQIQPNNCNSAICGLDAPEECHSTLQGFCSEQPFRTCIPGGQDVCGAVGAGTCEVEFRSCFGGEITRTGSSAPLGTFCSQGPETAPCASNADCSDPDAICTSNSSRGSSVALYCFGASSSPAYNNAYGLTGPAAIRFESFWKMCACGDGLLGCDEQCDDGNQQDGDGCDRFCRDE